MTTVYMADGSKHRSGELVTQAQVRRAFWDEYPAFRPLRRPRGQNAQLTDVCCAFVDYVDMLARRVTL